MTQCWTDRLSEYLDGELPAAEARELESHLGGCQACTVALEKLRDVVARARGRRELDDSIGVGSNLWPGIEARIRDLPVSSVRPLPKHSAFGLWWRGALFSAPQLALACLAVAAVSVAIFQLPGGLRDRDPFGGRNAARGGLPVVQVSSESARAAFTEIDHLKQVLHSRRDQLDPETLRALEESLTSMEQAVQEASRALDADPGNPYIKSHLDELRVRQLDLLRRAVSLAGGAE